MKVFIKKLGGTKFEIEVNPQDTVADVKKLIETVEGENVYPAARQMLIHHGNIIKDGTTLNGNNVAENDGILVIGSLLPVQSGSNTLADPLDPYVFMRNSRHFTKYDTELFYFQFLPLRALMVSNPRTFEPVLGEVVRQYPGLMGPISDDENRTDFFRLFDAPPNGTMPRINLNFDASVDRTWTLEEYFAILDLEELGFSYLLASEVFYSCNKDKEAAAAFLLSHLIFDD